MRLIKKEGFEIYSDKKRKEILHLLRPENYKFGLEASKLAGNLALC